MRIAIGQTCIIAMITRIDDLITRLVARWSGPQGPSARELAIERFRRNADLTGKVLPFAF